MKHELAGHFFKAGSQAEYEALQLALFGQGCKWGGGDGLKNEYFDRDKRYDGYAYISVTESGRMWRDSDGVEGQVNYKTACVATVEKAVVTVVVDGKTYRLDDVLEAIGDNEVEEIEV